MATLTIIGATYRELCTSPPWDQLYGSGLRAAVACSSLCQVELFTWCDSSERAELDYRARAASVSLNVDGRADAIQFYYEHPLARPEIHPSVDAIRSAPARRIDAESVLMFGLLEATAEVTAKRLVYDPQAGARAKTVPTGATELSVVANMVEARALLGDEPPPMLALEAAERILGKYSAVAVVVKNGSEGAAIATPERREVVPCYPSAEVFSIGSGDVFSAVFSWAWMMDRRAPEDAANLASQAVSYYCGHGTLDLPSDRNLWRQGAPHHPRTSGARLKKRIYLAGPLFTVADRWLIGETRRCLVEFGFDVFSPFHDVGVGSDATSIAGKDLEGLDTADAVFALVDGLDAGTLFEIGYATAKRLPVVAYAERAPEQDLTMLAGTGVTIFRDYATSIYQLYWITHR